MERTVRTGRVSVAQVWAVAQDPDAVTETLRIAREANAKLGEASDAVTEAYVRLARVVPRAMSRGRIVQGGIRDELARLRPVLRRLRVLAGQEVTR